MDAFGNALGEALVVGSGQAAGSRSSAGEDRLGAFIEQNQGAWNQRQANYDRMVDAFGNPTAYDRNNDVLLAAGPGYGGMGMGSGDRLQVNRDISVFEEASALAASSGQASTNRSSGLESQAQAASDLYANGFGDVRDTSPATGLLVNPDTGLADFKYTSQVGNAMKSSLDGLFSSNGNSASPAWSTLRGVASGIGSAVYEMGAPMADLLQVGNELGRSWVTGEPLRDINYVSAVGKMAGAGASTAGIVNGGFMSLMTAPDRITSAYQRGEYQQMGEEIGALGIGAAAAAAGARGAIPSVRMGVQLAVEDFAASGTGQRFGVAMDRFNYQLGNVNYVVAPQQRVMGWSEKIPETSPYVTPYDPQYPGRPDPAYSIDTSRFNSGTPTSGAGGGLRNSSAYWKAWAEQVPESLSPGNLRLAQRGLAPEIDQTWVSKFPQNAAYLGDDLIHHHTNFGQYAIPVPASTHTSSSGIWHLQGVK